MASSEITISTPVEERVLSSDMSSEINQPQLDHDRIFGSLFDEYIRIADGNGQLPSVNGRDPSTKNPTFEYVDRPVVAGAKLRDLRLYIKYAMVNNGLGIEPTMLRAGAPVTLDGLVDRYIEIGVEKARAKVLEKGRVAAHVTVSEVDSTPDTTRRFKDILLKGIPDMARSAFTSIDSGLHFLSGEIPRQDTTPIPSDEIEHLIRK